LRSFGVPLEILLPMVVIGITGVVLLIRWLHPTPDYRLADQDQVAKIWNHRNVEVAARAVHLNTEHSHALVETDQGVGVVWVFGADPVTRLLDQPFDLEPSGNGLRIQTNDFTAPHIDLALDGAEIDRWHNILAQNP
jgi:hypothetical protein